MVSSNNNSSSVAIANHMIRALVKKYIGPVPFFVLNVTFISFMQSVLLYLLAVPTYAILLASQNEKDISGADIVFTAVQVALVASEFVSDQQQWGKSEEAVFL